MSLDADELADNLYSALGIGDLTSGGDRGPEMRESLYILSKTIIDYFKANMEVTGITGSVTFATGDIVSTNVNNIISNPDPVTGSFSQSGTGSVE